MVDHSGDTEEKFDVFIHATREQIDEKLETNVPDDHYCYWTVNGTPRQTATGQRVWFETGGEIVAGARIVGLESGKLWFEPALETRFYPPKEPPERGFAYIEPPQRRLGPK